MVDISAIAHPEATSVAPVCGLAGQEPSASVST
jgi:hypothetical protein